MKPITISQLKAERPEAVTEEDSMPEIPSRRWFAWVKDRVSLPRFGPTEREALQSLANAMKWDVEVVEDPRCAECKEPSSELSVMGLCKKCSPVPTYCTRCGKLIDGCVCEDGPKKPHLPAQGYPGNWTEDYAHENGNYINQCIHCDALFYGHKRRVVCKVCFGTPSHPTPTPRTDAMKMDAWDLANLVEVGKEPSRECVRLKDARTLEQELNEAREKDSAALQLVKRLAEWVDEEANLVDGIATGEQQESHWTEWGAIEQEARRIVGGTII